MLQILNEVFDRSRNKDSENYLSWLIILGSIPILWTVVWDMYLYSMKYEKTETGENIPLINQKPDENDENTDNEQETTLLFY